MSRKLILVLLLLAVFFSSLFFARRYLDPAPPNHFTIATGEDDGDYQGIAKQYQKILKRDGVDLEIRSSEGPLENLKLLEADELDVDAGFVQDGLGSPSEQPDLVSLGSLYYEPIWVFYRGSAELTRLSQLIGKKIAVGRQGHGTRLIAAQLLKESGVEESNSHFVDIGIHQAADALKKGEVDAAFFLLTPEDPLIESLAQESSIHLMSFDQAEAISRQFSYMHHLVLPHGSFDLKKNIPNRDIDLVAPTATLLVRDDLHPALVYLLMKAASEVHSLPGMFEKRGEFPINKDDQFPLSSDAQQYYKSGGPFWQRYLPFWLAAWVDRIFLFVIPFVALFLPLLRMIPQFFDWRIRSRIHKQYGELKYLETQIESSHETTKLNAYMSQLNSIEARVNRMKIPLKYTEHLYSLRGHIHFVRERLERILAQ